MLPWGPLGAGFLSGKYQRGERPPEGSRIADADETLEEAYDRRAVERNFAVVDAAGAIAEERGATIAQVALAWLLGTPGVTAPIVGPRTFAQLEDLLGADGLRLTGEERARLEAPARPAADVPAALPARAERDRRRRAGAPRPRRRVKRRRHGRGRRQTPSIRSTLPV